jgi:hypothetical protein
MALNAQLKDKSMETDKIWIYHNDEIVPIDWDDSRIEWNGKVFPNNRVKFYHKGEHYAIWIYVVYGFTESACKAELLELLVQSIKMER